MAHLRTSLALTLALLIHASTSAAELPAKEDAKRLAFFESRIRPVLVEQCYSCHSRVSGKSSGGLRLDSRETIRTGGTRGPAVVPGHPKKSLILSAISHLDDDLAMPPKKERLSAVVLADFQKWISDGAIDPRDESALPAGIDLKAARNFWAYRKPTAPPRPTVANADWAKRDLDRFILAKLESQKLAPSPDAAPATLLRRLHFDLVGLPPSPEVAAKFLDRVKQKSLDLALEEEVDSLLASPHFGERWGRHWLDVARFAESSGKEANITFPYAWRYRNYVIDAVNADVPFDRFLTEQLAGDMLESGSPQERARLLIATGFLAIGPKNLDEMNEAQFDADLVDEQIDVATRAFMASSVACARCHDHKFEPFEMRDYYSLAGIFRSTKTYFGTYVTPINQRGGDPLMLPRDAKLAAYHESVSKERVAKLKADLAALKKEHADRMAAVLKAAAEGKDTEGVFTLRDALRIFWSSGGIEGQLEKVDDQGQALPLAMGVMNRGVQIIDSPIYERGDITRPGPTVPRGLPRVFAIEGFAKLSEYQSGRLELAKWLTYADHPLTARVFVNRTWRHLFGAGLVRTVDNFGPSGETPSHPELLDQLALQFQASGWSVKKLVREMVLSRTYRMASDHRADGFAKDPDNRWLWRASKRRLDAEAIRDAMLAAAGDLDTQRPEASLVGKVIGDRAVSLIGLDPKIPRDLDSVKHRSVYLPVLRDRLPDVLELFDFAEPSLVTGDRDTTSTPLQAHYLMNSPFVQERAQKLAERLMSETKDEPSRIRRAFRLCFNREPDADEMRLTAEFLARGRKLPSVGDTQYWKLFAAFCQSLLATAEFRIVD